MPIAEEFSHFIDSSAETIRLMWLLPNFFCFWGFYAFPTKKPQKPNLRSSQAVTFYNQ